MISHENGISLEPSLKSIEAEMPNKLCKSWYMRWDESDYQLLMRTSHNILSQVEFCEGMRMLDKAHTLKYWCSRLALRLSLTRYTEHSVSPSAWVINELPSGKVSVDHTLIRDNGIDVSISHSNGMVVCAITKEASIGIDIEPVTRLFSPTLINHDIFTARELKQLRSKNTEDRNSLALRLWTLKGACAKTTGLGMGVNFSDIDLRSNEKGQFQLKKILHDGNPFSNWQLKQHLFQKDHLLSIATASAERSYNSNIQATHYEYV